MGSRAGWQQCESRGIDRRWKQGASRIADSCDRLRGNMDRVTLSLDDIGLGSTLISNFLSLQLWENEFLSKENNPQNWLF